MSIATKFIQAATYPKYRSFLKDVQNPEKAQKRVWNEIFHLVWNSHYWSSCKEKRHSHVSPRLQDFELTDYEDYRNHLLSAFQDPKGISPLTGEKILYWAKSTGTSAEPKLFPITHSYLRQFQMTTPPLLHSFTTRFKDFMKEPILYFASTLPSEQSPGGIDVGAISGFNYRNIPSLLKRFYGFPLEVFKDSETFFKWGPLYAISQDLSALIAISPSMIIRFAEILEEQISEYWPYLESKRDLPSFLPPIKVSKERVQLLRRAFSQKPFSFKDVWPTLQFICCWKSSTCGMQLPKLQSYLQGKVPVTDATYSATEGWMTVPLETSSLGGVFHPGGHIVEFLPIHDKAKKENLVSPWELIEGQEYEVVLTTGMGFIRYRLKDIVRCNGFFHRSPILEFRRKTSNLLSLGQTRISETDLLEAMEEARMSSHFQWFFGPSSNGDQLILYCDRKDSSISPLVRKIHTSLCQRNPEYADDIQNRLLHPLAAEFLNSTHPVWSKNTLAAQTKPSILHQASPLMKDSCDAQALA